MCVSLVELEEEQLRVWRWFAVLPQDSVVGAAHLWLREMRLFVTLGELFCGSNGTSRETEETETEDEKTVIR